LSSIKTVFITKCASVVTIHVFVCGLVYPMSCKFLNITKIQVVCMSKHNSKCNPLRWNGQRKIWVRACMDQNVRVGFVCVCVCVCWFPSCQLILLLICICSVLQRQLLLSDKRIALHSYILLIIVMFAIFITNVTVLQVIHASITACSSVNMPTLHLQDGFYYSRH
jgi:hypothetical protein